MFNPFCSVSNKPVLFEIKLVADINKTDALTSGGVLDNSIFSDLNEHLGNNLTAKNSLNKI